MYFISYGGLCNIPMLPTSQIKVTEFFKVIIVEYLYMSYDFWCLCKDKVCHTSCKFIMRLLYDLVSYCMILYHIV